MFWFYCPFCWSTFKTTVYVEKLSAFSFLWDKMPYGTVIIRNGLINRCDVEKYIGTSHAYSAIPWESMLSSTAIGKCLFYSDYILVELGEIEKTWKSNAIDIFMYQISFVVFNTTWTIYHEK